MDEYQLLIVSREGSSLTAVLPEQHYLETMYKQPLSRDLYLLRESEASSITLDLRAVENIGSFLLGRLIQLARLVTCAGSQFSVKVSPNVAELMKICMLDKVIHIE